MTEQEINQTIHEARGLKWHIHKFKRTQANGGGEYTCSSCESRKYYVSYYSDEKELFETEHRNLEYTSSWADYGQALEWAMEQEWWPLFIDSLYDMIVFLFGKSQIEVFAPLIFNPFRGSTALAEFLKAHKKEGV